MSSNPEGRGGPPLPAEALAMYQAQYIRAQQAQLAAQAHLQAQAQQAQAHNSGFTGYDFTSTTPAGLQLPAAGLAGLQHQQLPFAALGRSSPHVETAASLNTALATQHGALAQAQSPVPSLQVLLQALNNDQQSVSPIPPTSRSQHALSGAGTLHVPPGPPVAMATQQQATRVSPSTDQPQPTNKTSLTSIQLQLVQNNPAIVLEKPDIGQRLLQSVKSDQMLVLRAKVEKVLKSWKEKQQKELTEEQVQLGKMLLIKEVAAQALANLTGSSTAPVAASIQPEQRADLSASPSPSDVIEQHKPVLRLIMRMGSIAQKAGEDGSRLYLTNVVSHGVASEQFAQECVQAKVVAADEFETVSNQYAAFAKLPPMSRKQLFHLALKTATHANKTAQRDAPQPMVQSQTIRVGLAPLAEETPAEPDPEPAPDALQSADKKKKPPASRKPRANTGKGKGKGKQIPDSAGEATTPGEAPSSVGTPATEMLSVQTSALGVARENGDQMAPTPDVSTLMSAATEPKEPKEGDIKRAFINEEKIQGTIASCEAKQVEAEAEVARVTEAAKADEANEQLKAELLQAKKNLQNAKRNVQSARQRLEKLRQSPAYLIAVERRDNPVDEAGGEGGGETPAAKPKPKRPRAPKKKQAAAGGNGDTPAGTENTEAPARANDDATIKTEGGEEAAPAEGDEAKPKKRPCPRKPKKKPAEGERDAQGAEGEAAEKGSGEGGEGDVEAKPPKPPRKKAQRKKKKTEAEGEGGAEVKEGEEGAEPKPKKKARRKRPAEEAELDEAALEAKRLKQEAKEARKQLLEERRAAKLAKEQEKEARKAEREKKEKEKLEKARRDQEKKEKKERIKEERRQMKLEKNREKERRERQRRERELSKKQQEVMDAWSRFPSDAADALILGEHPDPDEANKFMRYPPLKYKIAECARRNGIKVREEAVMATSAAVRERMKLLLEQLIFNSHHRSDNPIRQSDGLTVTHNVKRQLKIFERMDQQALARKRQEEKIDLQKIAKSRSKYQDDPERARAKEKFKMVREAEEAEKRHNQANATAIMMIGGFQRSKAVLKSKAGTNQRAGSPGPSSPLPLVSTPGAPSTPGVPQTPANDAPPETPGMLPLEAPETGSLDLVRTPGTGSGHTSTTPQPIGRSDSMVQSRALAPKRTLPGASTAGGAGGAQRGIVTRRKILMRDLVQVLETDRSLAKTKFVAKVKMSYGAKI